MCDAMIRCSSFFFLVFRAADVFWMDRGLGLLFLMSRNVLPQGWGAGKSYIVSSRLLSVLLYLALFIGFSERCIGGKVFGIYLIGRG